AEGLDRAQGRGRAAARGRRPGHCRTGLGGGAGRAAAPVRGRSAAARRRPVPSAFRARRPERPPAVPLARRRRPLRRLPGRGGPRAGAARRHLVAGGDRRSCRSTRTMSYQTCPDWPELMELAPDLQFKHMTVREAQLPAEALMKIPDVHLDETEICADIDRHVFFARHTDPRVVEALKGSHWFDL